MNNSSLRLQELGEWEEVLGFRAQGLVLGPEALKRAVFTKSGSDSYFQSPPVHY